MLTQIAIIPLLIASHSGHSTAQSSFGELHLGFFKSPVVEVVNLDILLITGHQE